MQAMTPDELERATFTIAFRGYDRDEVDGYLRAAADGIRILIKDTSENAYRNLGEDMGALLQHAKDSAEALTNEAQAQAAAIKEAADRDAREARAKAEQDAAAMRSEAEADAANTRQRADRDAEAERAEAERDAAERIAAADVRVRELEALEDQVRTRLRSLREDLYAITGQLGRVDQRTGSDEPTEVIRLEHEAESPAV